MPVLPLARVGSPLWVLLSLLLGLLLTASGCTVRPAAPVVPAPVVPEAPVSRAQIGPSPGGFGLVTEATVPATCTPGRQMVLVVDADDGSCPLRRCDLTGVAFACVVQGAQGLQSTGVRLSPTEILAVNHAVLPLATSVTLGTHNRILAQPGVDGQTLTLPDAASATVSDYWIAIADNSGGPLTLAPSGTNTINGENTARTLTGRGQFFQVKRLVAAGWTDWFVEQTTEELYVFAAAGYAPTAAGLMGFDTTKGAYVGGTGSGTQTFTGAYSVQFGGSTNNSASGSGTQVQHTPAFTLPANTLTLGKKFTLCGQFAVTTGSATPNLEIRARLGTTSFGVGSPVDPSINMTARGFIVCWMGVVAEAPSASSDIYTSMVSVPSAMTTGTISNFSTAMPQAYNTAGTLVANLTTEWDSAGTGTNTITLQWFSLEVTN